MLACLNGHSDVVGKLLQVRSVKVNRQDKNGHSALLVGVYGNHTKVVSKLLKASRINLNIQDSKGRTALMLAVFKVALLRMCSVGKRLYSN